MPGNFQFALSDTYCFYQYIIIGCYFKQISNFKNSADEVLQGNPLMIMNEYIHRIVGPLIHPDPVAQKSTMVKRRGRIYTENRCLFLLFYKRPN